MQKKCKIKFLALKHELYTWKALSKINQKSMHFALKSGLYYYSLT